MYPEGEKENTKLVVGGKGMVGLLEWLHLRVKKKKNNSMESV
jgi:hypothetical protein